jgi:hypothetical protein
MVREYLSEMDPETAAIVANGRTPKAGGLVGRLKVALRPE